MDIEKYIGFKVETLKEFLEENNVEYNIIEVWDTKKTKIGDDFRVIKVEKDNKLTIYASYF